MNKKLMIHLATAAVIVSPKNSENFIMKNYLNSKSLENSTKNQVDKMNVSYQNIVEHVDIDRLLKSKMLIATPAG